MRSLNNMFENIEETEVTKKNDCRWNYKDIPSI